jgi:CPA1 family monovalent cation:H+ antiporter
MPDIILIVSALLALAFLATRLASLLRVPHSVFLVILGILGGLGLKAAHLHLPAALENTYPDVVLYLLLPPLVFESAYQMDSRQLFRDWIPTTGLAIFGMLLNSLLIGLGLHWFLQVRLEAALLFGALISATDPVAVVSLFKEIGAPNRLATLVEGESLLNDGTALVLYRVLLGAALGQTIDPAAGLLQFLFVCLGGIATGGLFIGIVSAMLRVTSQSGVAQVGITVAIAFSSFIVAEHWLHVSGVLSTLTVGLYLGQRARLELNRDALHSMHNLWEFVALSANSLVFLAVGLTVDLAPLWASIHTLPVVLLLVYLARTIAVGSTLIPLSLLGWGKRVDYAYQAVIVWAGLRGGLALALVLMIPNKLPEKSLFLAFATAVVLTSLLINALTTPPLLRKLGLNKLSDQDHGLYLRSLKQTLETVFNNYQDAADHGTLSTHVLETIRQSADQLTHSPLPLSQAYTSEFQRVLLYEQKHYDEQLELDILSAPAYRALSDSVATRLRLLNDDEPDSLGEYDFQLNLKKRSFWLGRTELDQLALELEVLLHLNLWLTQQTDPLQKCWAKISQTRLDEFYQSVPHLALAVQHRFLSRSIFASVNTNLEELHEAGIVPDAVLARAHQAMESFLAQQAITNKSLFNPSTRDLLKHSPLFGTLSETVLLRIEACATPTIVSPGTTVIQEATPADSCYLVLRGTLAVTSNQQPIECPRLFAGAIFGASCLLHQSQSHFTITSETECNLLRIDLQLFNQLLEEFPEFRTEMTKSKHCESS